MIYKKLRTRQIAVVAVVSLSISGLFGFGAPAYAATALEPTIIFDGNTLATSAPTTDTSTRVSADSLRLSTESLVRTASTTRTGYTFGGWALTRGGAATNEITTTTTGDTTRTLFAVWNTTIFYDATGVTTGELT